MKIFSLLKAECSKVFGDIKIYYINYIFGNLNVFFMFFGLFYAFSKNNQTDTSKLLFLFGLMYWYFGVHAIDLISILIEEEIEQGTLEQLLLTRTSLSISLAFRIIAQILFDLFKGIFVFFICMVSFKIDFSIVFSLNFWISVLVFFVGLFAMYGFGYLVAGLSLIYKQASSIASISSTLILFFSGTSISIEKFPEIIQYIIMIFPFYWSNNLIESILFDNYAQIPFSMLILFVELLFWISIGILTLNYCLETVYEKGTSGTY